MVGSHKAGRISHVAQGGQVGADMERVQLLVDRFPLLHAEMSAGDGLFFHANMLHRSDSNKRYGECKNLPDILKLSLA